MSVATTYLPPAISNGDVILIVVALAVPIAAIAFATGAGRALREIGKGPLGVEFEADLGARAAADPEPSRADREAEIRQLLEGKAYRRRARGEPPLDVERELARLLSEPASGPLDDDAALRAEVRQLVVARNERRARQGKPALEVEAEVARQLRELEGLGQ